MKSAADGRACPDPLGGVVVGVGACGGGGGAGPPPPALRSSVGGCACPDPLGRVIAGEESCCGGGTTSGCPEPTCCSSSCSSSTRSCPSTNIELVSPLATSTLAVCTSASVDCLRSLERRSSSRRSAAVACSGGGLWKYSPIRVPILYSGAFSAVGAGDCCSCVASVLAGDSPSKEPPGRHAVVEGFVVALSCCCAIQCGVVPYMCCRDTWGGVGDAPYRFLLAS